MILWIVALLSGASHAAVLAGRLAQAARRDTVCAVWVLFRDKRGADAAPRLSRAALARRAAAHFPPASGDDVAISAAYLRQIEALGATRRHLFPWANAASFRVHASLLAGIARQECVRCIIPVRQFTRPGAPSRDNAAQKAASGVVGLYGVSDPHLRLAAVTAAHSYLMNGLQVTPGSGVIIGVFDTGFLLNHRCFQFMRERQALVADSDFVDRDDDLTDFANHGTAVLGLIAGYDPGNFLGVAWGARFVLARTENDSSERHTEEDNWASALCWAESLGATIINSSIGYRTGFTPPDQDYTYEDIDGKSTIISKAARAAVERGMIIVNAIGNEGFSGPGSLDAPADVDGVIAAGGVTAGGLRFSPGGLGPTFDGRIKPDLVAQARDVAVPMFDTPGSYTIISGTSFASPVIAGICALVKQSHPLQGAADIRNMLYASCRFAPQQSSVDNCFGRGIPDAYIACVLEPEQFTIAPNQLQLFVRSGDGMPVEGAIVAAENGTELAVTNRRGYATALFADSRLPSTLMVSYRQLDSRQAVAVSALPARAAVTLRLGGARVLVRHSARDSLRAVQAAVVYWRTQGAPGFAAILADSLGIATIYYPAGAAPGGDIYAEAPGYYACTPRRINLQTQTEALTVILQPRPAADFSLYPNVVKLSRGNPAVRCAFAGPGGGNTSQLLSITVRTSSGVIVWRHSEYAASHQGLRRAEWNCRAPNGALIAPGTYFVTVRNGSKTYAKKLMVQG